MPLFFWGTHLKLEDFRSNTWKRLTQHINDRIDELRELNDNQSFDERKTAGIRGGIAELKRILALAEEASASPAVDPSELSGVGDTIGQQ